MGREYGSRGGVSLALEGHQGFGQCDSVITVCALAAPSTITFG